MGASFGDLAVDNAAPFDRAYRARYRQRHAEGRAAPARPIHQRPVRQHGGSIPVSFDTGSRGVTALSVLLVWLALWRRPPPVKPRVGDRS
jgi:hypothetical protein